MIDEPDAHLLQRFVDGDQDAFETLFRMFQLEVFRWVVRIVRDRSAAEDAVVETFWRAFRARARFDPSRPFGAWLRRIATNVALNHVRTARARGAWSLLDTDAVAAPGVDAGLVAETRHAVAVAFRALPAKLYVVAMLALVEQQSYSEIADALGIPVGTVKSRVSRATHALRAELSRLGIQQ